MIIIKENIEGIIKRREKEDENLDKNKVKKVVIIRGEREVEIIGKL